MNFYDVISLRSLYHLIVSTLCINLMRMIEIVEFIDYWILIKATKSNQLSLLFT